jgi:type II secretory pathway pseudopilin PulG
MSRPRRLRRWWPVLPIAALALLAYAALPGRWTFTVSPETTYVTGPLDAQGYVDYPTALNERLGKGVNPDNNANVLIWKAFGPRPEGGNGMPAEYFRWLGIDEPPPQGDYFVGSNRYFEDHLKNKPGADAPDPGDWFEQFFGEPDEVRPPPDQRQRWFDQLSRAAKWPWKAKDYADLADWLKRNEKPLAVMAEAARRPKYFNPLVPRDPSPQQARILSSLLPSVQKCRDVASALACRAMGRVADGDFDGAWQDLLTCQRLGRHLGNGATLIESLVGMAMVQIATTGELTLLSHSKASSKQVLGWLDDLRKLPPMPPFAGKMDLGERFNTLDAMQSIACGGPRGLAALSDGPGPGKSPGNPVWDRLFTRSIDFDPGFRNANRMFDQCAEAARLPDRQARQAELARVEQSIAGLRPSGGLGRVVMSKAERGEEIGNILIKLLFPALKKIQDAADRTEQTERNVHVAFALAAYRADHGRYPERLSELAPKYLPEVPGDLFSGNPLIWRPGKGGYLFYSIGVNGLDEDGRWRDDDPPGDDLRVRMPVPEPK